MTHPLTIVAFTLITFAIGMLCGVAVERDRYRSPARTVELPRALAVATRLNAKQWRRERRDLNRGARWRS